MEYSSPCGSILSSEEEDMRKGPWTVEEDHLLINYVTSHGEGRWNSLARSAGLKRSGKSCRLRWLNYLRPNVRRGNITPEEQLLILELHSRWGNRWSKIAQHLPGRTDNEIKNYWRTRVQKHAKQLRCDVNSKQFKDLMRYIWMPRLIERIHSTNSNNTNISAPQDEVIAPQLMHQNNVAAPASIMITNNSSDNSSITSCGDSSWASSESQEFMQFSSPVPPLMCESFSSGAGNTQSGEFSDRHVGSWIQEISDDEQQLINKCWLESLPSPATGGLASGFGFNNFEQCGNLGDNLWASDDWLQNVLNF